MGTAPYNPEKKSPDRASVGHNGSSSSASSGALSGSFQGEKQWSIGDNDNNASHPSKSHI